MQSNYVESTMYPLKLDFLVFVFLHVEEEVNIQLELHVVHVSSCIQNSKH